MRRKKTADEVATEVPPVPAMKVVERREYITQMPTTKPSEPQTVTVPATIMENEEEGDDLLDFLTQLDEELGLILRVDRLPQYMTTGKWSKGAPFEYCDDLPISKQELKSGMYLTYLKQMFGPGAYRITLKESTGQFIKSWPVKIAAQTPAVVTRAGQPMQQVIMQPQAEAQPPRDTLQELLDAGEKAAKLKRIFGWDNQPVAPVATPAPVTVEQPPLQDRIVEAALNFALKTEKPETVAGLLQNYLNPKSDEFPWKEIIGEIIKPLAPMIVGILGAYAQNQARQQAGQPNLSAQNGQQAMQLSPIQSQQPQSQMWSQPTTEQTIPQNGINQWSAQTEPMIQQPNFQITEFPQNLPNIVVQRQVQDEPLSPEEEEDMARDQLIYDLADMLEQCVREAASNPDAIAKGRQEVLAYKQRFPFMTGLLDALVGMPPEAVIGLLAAKVPEVAAMMNNEIAKQTIRDFQASLRQPREEQE